MALQVAEEIKRQIEAIDKMALWSWGANSFVGADTDNKTHSGFLMFNIKNTKNYKKGKIRVTLMFNDTYTIDVFKAHSFEADKTIDDVYCDELVNIIDELLEK